MLSKFILRAGATAVALTCAAGAASAENYRILMLDYAFFPEISYVLPGDTITFVNASGTTRTIEAQDAEWLIEDLADGGESTLAITQGMKNEYSTVALADGETEIVIGKLNFSGLPSEKTN